MTSESNIFLGNVPLNAIVINEDATELTAYAASELQKYLRNALNCTLEIKRGTPTVGCFHLVQRSFPEDRKLFDRTWIKDMGAWLELAGENPISVLYAVYDFLKSCLGIRFFAAGEAFEHVPHQQVLNLPINFQKEFGSAFEIRDFVNRTNSPDVLSFAVKNRINTILGCGPWKDGSENCSYENARLIHSYGLKVRGPGHSWKHFVPNNLLFNEHPEYFPMKDGRRQPNGRTACFSNPEVRRIFRENLRVYLHDHPYWDIFAFWAEDLPDMHYCQCPECSKHSTTDWYLTLANEAAEVVAEVLPNVRFEFIVYQGTNNPPQTIQKFFRDGENMLVNFCFGQTRDLFRPFEKRTYTNDGLFELYSNWRSFLRNIGYKGKTMLMEYYNLCEYPDTGPCGRALMWPLRVMQQDIQFYLRDGLNGLGAFTGFDRLAFPSPWKHWAWMNLWTNPNLDLDALQKDFLQCYYGEDTQTVGAYFQKLEDVMFTKLSEENLAELEGLGAMLDGLSGERFDIIRIHLRLAILVKHLHWAFQCDNREDFEAWKKQYLTYQQDNATLLAKMVAPFPMLWFDFILNRIGWLPDGTKRKIRLGTEETLL